MICQKKIFQLSSQDTFFAISDISKKKFHLIVEEYDGETLSNDEAKNVRKLLKNGYFTP